MENKTKNFEMMHPFVIFWIGVLTGAIIVGLVFFYRVLNPQQYESALIKPSKTWSFQKSIIDYRTMFDPIAIGDPEGF